MFLRERAALANSSAIWARRYVLPCRISWEGRRIPSRRFIRQIQVLAHGYSDTPGTVVDPTDRSAGRYNGSRLIRMTGMHRVIHTFKESDTLAHLPTYLPTYLSAPGQFASQMELAAARSPVGLFAGRWTWLFCGLGTTAIYNIEGLKPIRHVSSQYCRLPLPV